MTATTSTRNDPATLAPADDALDDLERDIAEETSRNPAYPALLAAEIARQDREAAPTRWRRRRAHRRPFGHPRPRATALPPITDLG